LGGSSLRPFALALDCGDDGVMPFLRRQALDRRTFLRGGAACMALPWLDAMAPAMSGPPKGKPRAVFVYAPNGMNMEEWRPKGQGHGAKFGGTLTSLEPLRKRLTAFSGLGIDAGSAHGDGPGDHARAVSTYLTCAHPRKTGGADIHVGVSVDQAIAKQIGGASPFASLEVGMDRGKSAGVCDSGYSCAYSNNMSWVAPDQPVAKEADPRAVFARLFGDPESALNREQQRQQRDWDRSVLDLVNADAKSLRNKLGPADRRKLEQYLESVRELEKRLQQEPEEEELTPVPDGLLDGSRDFPKKLQLMYELVVLALTTERTRVVTFMLGNGGSNRSFRFLGVPEGHHTLSHHGKVEKKRAAIAKIDRFYVDQFASFLQRLTEQQDGDADLLSNSLVLYGSGISDGNRHNHHDLPMLLCGEGAGAAKAQGHITHANKTPMANLYLSVMKAMGCRADQFADSREPLRLR
jgi:hypothetical protein